MNKAASSSDSTAARQPLAIDVGVKGWAYPQLVLHLVPDQRFAFHLSAFGNFPLAISDDFFVEVAVPFRFPLREKLSAYVGPGFRWYGSSFGNRGYNPDHFRSPMYPREKDDSGHTKYAVGAMGGIDYRINDRFEVFFDLSLTVGVLDGARRGGVTGLGVAYRIKQD